jgi:uncharacterized small protein (DUF1192 family)
MVGSGIFSIFGAGLNAAISAGTANEQWGNQLQLMDIQNRYNEKMAKNNQKRNKDLWDYTNYENQTKHIKAAGLNPALIYGMGGGGGASASGAQGQGVTQPTDRSVEMKLKQQGMGLQLESIASQIELNKSQAEKNKAEANKIAGADTKVAEKEAEMLESQSEFNKRITKLQDSIEKLTKAQEQKTAAEYFYTQAQEKKVWEEVREQVVKADVAENTKRAMIRKATLENFNLMQTGIESITRQKLNMEQINYLKGQIAIGWANVAIGEKSIKKQEDK